LIVLRSSYENPKKKKCKEKALLRVQNNRKQECALEKKDRVWGNLFVCPKRAAAHQTKIKIDSLSLFPSTEITIEKKKREKNKNLIGKIELPLWLFWSGGQGEQIISYKDNVFIFF
jgi:hypothetical protein